MLRRAFLFLLVLAVHPPSTVLASAAPPPVRGGRVGWARLISSNNGWGAHQDRDPQLARFIGSQTSLNIDPTWYSVEPSSLEALCNYPFIYAKSLSPISNERELRNLGEFIRRGGFICVDPCLSGYTAEQTAAFLRNHRELFARIVPGCEMRELPDGHELFRCYFNVSVDDLFTTDMIRLGAQKPSHLGMQGIFQGERMIALISVSGLECGWPQTPLRTPGCMKMIVNAYVYAMTRAAESAVAPP